MGFSPFIIKPTDVSSGYYSETARNLEAMLNEALALCSGVGIIIDEGEKIFEKPEQENRDTKQTATALTGWLDEYSQSKRKDAIVIITANEIKHMPDHLLSRTTGFQFKFTGPDTPEKKAQAFLLYVTVPDDQRDMFIQQMAALFKEFPRFNGRDLRQIVTVGSSFKRRRDAASSTTPIDYKQAMEKIMAERKESGYYEKDVDDAERRHKEAMDQQENGMLLNLVIMAAKIGWELG
jgi:SpoVK/Ycf46/Vps4 family AAA+-type ATPase